MSATTQDECASQALSRSGMFYAAAAFGWWGLVFPLLLLAVNARAEQIGHTGSGTVSQLEWSLEFLTHRALWAFVSCAVLLTYLGQWNEFRRLRSSARSVYLLATTAALLLANWLGFVYGAATGRLSHASLGYYITPLFSVVLGILVLQERLRPGQALALTLAAAGVVWETVRLGELPWISLLVAGAFGMYGLLRKQIHASALTGLALEALVLLPVALGYIVWRESVGPAPAFGRDGLLTGLLILSGVATAAPLIWFARAAKRLPLSSLAFLQFIVPTGQLILAVTLNGESLTIAALLSFALIWLGVAMFLVDLRTTS